MPEKMMCWIADPGEHIRDFAAVLIEDAKVHETAKGIFNGIELNVKPEDTVESIVAYYHSKLA